MRWVMIFSCALVVGCGSHPGAHKNIGPDMSAGAVVTSANFDPCSPARTGGLDPVAARLPSCCSGAAHCLPAHVVPDALVPSLSSCAGGGVCLPDKVIRAGADFTPKACASSLAQRPSQLTGVCLSRCLSRVANDPEWSRFPQDGCDAGEACIPCLSPFSSGPTGACTLLTPHCGGGDDGGAGGGSDASAPIEGGGPAMPPPMCPYDGPPLLDVSILPPCAPACNGAHCVPNALVPAAQQAQLASCDSNGQPGLCAPDTMVASFNLAVPPPCRSVAGAEGRCLSTCVATIAAQASLLPDDVCPAGSKCAPCFNPTAADPTLSTGACNLACDAPKEPPLILTCPWTGPPVLDPAVLPACSPSCSGAHCVPAAEVPPSQRAMLAACPGGYCTPDPNITTGNNYVPPTCDAFIGTPAEGRCLSTCLPPIAAQASQLHQHTCSDGQLCAPCYDPFSGADTGACTSSCDKPAQPKYTFPLCCHTNEGTCVPTENIPSSQQSNLKADTCPAQMLCVPDDLLPGKTPPSCTTLLLLKGVCLSDCTTAPALGQSGCPAHHNCIPCLLAPAGTPGC